MIIDRRTTSNQRQQPVAAATSDFRRKLYWFRHAKNARYKGCVDFSARRRRNPAGVRICRSFPLRPYSQQTSNIPGQPCSLAVIQVSHATSVFNAPPLCSTRHRRVQRATAVFNAPPPCSTRHRRVQRATAVFTGTAPCFHQLECGS